VAHCVRDLLVVNGKRFAIEVVCFDLCRNSRHIGPFCLLGFLNTSDIAPNRNRSLGQGRKSSELLLDASDFRENLVCNSGLIIVLCRLIVTDEDFQFQQALRLTQQIEGFSSSVFIQLKPSLTFRNVVVLPNCVVAGELPHALGKQKSYFPF